MNNDQPTSILIKHDNTFTKFTPNHKKLYWFNDSWLNNSSYFRYLDIIKGTFESVSILYSWYKNFNSLNYDNSLNHHQWDRYLIMSVDFYVEIWYYRSLMWYLKVETLLEDLKLEWMVVIQLSPNLGV